MSSIEEVERYNAAQKQRRERMDRPVYKHMGYLVKARDDVIYGWEFYEERPRLSARDWHIRPCYCEDYSDITPL